MPLRSGRFGRPGVIERPVARIAGLADSAAVIARGVERRKDGIDRPSAAPSRRDADRRVPTTA